MKILLTIYMVMTVSLATAQVKVFSRKGVPEKDYLEINNQYPQTAGNAGAQELYKKLDSVIESSMPKDAKGGLLISTQICVNLKGAADYIFCELEDAPAYNKDSLSNVLRTSLAKGFTNWASGDKPSSPYGISSYRMIGKSAPGREVRQVDSSIVELKDAISYVDTLKIKRLYLHQLDLKRVPRVIYRFPNLEELYLGGNEIEAARIDVTRLPKLKQLHMQGNKLTDESFQITENKSLEILNLNENAFTDIPDAVRNCRKMTSLWLGGNKLTRLSSSSFIKLKQVKDLNFYKCSIPVLPKGIKKMRNLEVLDLYYNNLETLPNSITKLKKLSQLAISHNRLTILPKKIYKMKRVNTLYVHHNHLSVLPERISRLQNITILDLGYNWFTNFPTEIISFGNLSELDLSANNFSNFPDQLLAIKRLDKLYLRGNPFIDNQAGTKYQDELSQLKNKNIEVFY